jgi:O-acetylserine/cysteine efflux transporter
MPTFQFGLGERWAVVSAVAYTAVNVMLRSAAPTIDSSLGSLVRLLPLAVVAWAIVLREGGHELRPRSPQFLTWRLIGALVLGGSASLVLGNILYFHALNTGGLGITAGAVQGGSVLGGLWIGYLALRERPRREQVIGATILVAGLAAIAIAQSASIRDLWWLGLLLGLGAGSTYALANALSRIVQKERPLLFVALAVSGLGGLIPLSLMVGVRWLTGDPIAGDATAIGSVLLAGVANAAALASLALAVRHAPVASVNTITSASVVFSFVAAVVVFGESGSVPMIIGIALVTAGIVVSQVRRAQRPGEGGPRPGEPATPPEAVT